MVKYKIRKDRQWLINSDVVDVVRCKGIITDEIRSLWTDDILTVIVCYSVAGFYDGFKTCEDGIGFHSFHDECVKACMLCLNIGDYIFKDNYRHLFIVPEDLFDEMFECRVKEGQA